METLLLAPIVSSAHDWMSEKGSEADNQRVYQ